MGAKKCFVVYGSEHGSTPEIIKVLDGQKVECGVFVLERWGIHVEICEGEKHLASLVFCQDLARACLMVAMEDEEHFELERFGPKPVLFTHAGSGIALFDREHRAHAFVASLKDGESVWEGAQTVESIHRGLCDAAGVDYDDCAY